MSLPSKNDLMHLDVAWKGQVFTNLEAKPLNTLTLDYAWKGQPFVAPWRVRHRRIYLVE